MSNGFGISVVPEAVRHGIEKAYFNWYEMCGDWLTSAPEYFIVTHVCRSLERAIEVNKRSILLERRVHETIAEAGGVQRGRKAEALRGINGRFDMVLGRANGDPLVPIEIKTRVWCRGEKMVYKDIDRLMLALRSGHAHTKLRMGVFAFYTSCKKPVRKEETAIQRLRRFWETEFNDKLKNKYRKEYKGAFRVKSSISVHHGDNEYPDDAWGACTVVITRR